MIDYDPHEWFAHFFDVKGSMLREIVGRIALVVAWSIAVVLFDRFVWSGLELSEKAHALIGVALGLLLVFRTNSSYDRFWEARKLWGGMVNEARNLARAARVHLAADGALAAEAIRWTAAFPYAVMSHLRRAKPAIPPSIGLSEADLAGPLAAGHAPLAVTIRITERIAEARRRGLIGEVAQIEIERNVHLLVGYMGACERIAKTPLPFAYVVHLRRAVVLYCLTLPFALLPTFGWGTIPVTLVIAFILFGIEEIGVEIEEPFGTDDNDLPLERMCATIERDLLEVIGTIRG